MRKILFATLAAISLTLCIPVVLIYAGVIPYDSDCSPADSFTIHWYGKGPPISPRPPAPDLPDSGLPDQAAMENALAAMASYLDGFAEQTLADLALFRLSRWPADDEGKQPTRWQYAASTPILLAIPVTLLLPTWWCVRRFRASAYSRCNARARDSHLAARLITTSLALVLCIGLIVAHIRGSVSAADHGQGWSAPFGLRIGVGVLGNSARFEWDWFLHADDDPVIRQYRGEWFGGSVMLTYVQRVHASTCLIAFPMLFVEAFAGLLLLGTGRHLYREFRRVRRDNKGLCTQCGYDLRGGRERCPECGMPIPGPSDRAATQPGSTPEPR